MAIVMVGMAYEWELLIVNGMNPFFIFLVKAYGFSQLLGEI